MGDCDRDPIGGPPIEYLEVTCSNCKYKFRERPLDVGSPQGPPPAPQSLVVVAERLANSIYQVLDEEVACGEFCLAPMGGFLADGFWRCKIIFGAKRKRPHETGMLIVIRFLFECRLSASVIDEPMTQIHGRGVLDGAGNVRCEF